MPSTESTYGGKIEHCEHFFHAFHSGGCQVAVKRDGVIRAISGANCQLHLPTESARMNKRCGLMIARSFPKICPDLSLDLL